MNFSTSYLIDGDSAKVAPLTSNSGKTFTTAPIFSTQPNTNKAALESLKKEREGQIVEIGRRDREKDRGDSTRLCSQRKQAMSMTQGYTKHEASLVQASAKQSQMREGSL